MAGKGYLLDDIFPKCEHLDQNENYGKNHYVYNCIKKTRM